jgi:beta-lactamase class A
MPLTRRNFSMIASTLVAGSLIATSCLAATKKSSNALAINAVANNALTKKFAEIEKQLDARMGVAIVDTATGTQWLYRASERFPMCSTFKALAGAAVLTRVDAGKEDLNRRIVFETNELVTWSPVTEKRVGGEGMTVGEFCEAAITRSDNTAANFILKSLGGPAGVTEFVRTLGDSVTRLDRVEPELNEATPGDARDTSTPSAMAANLHALVLGHRLSEKSREQLKTWLIANKTGDAKLRAGVPKDWIVGDKTGAGEHGTVNDLAIMWPPTRKPLIVSVYITETKASFDDCNAAMAEIGHLLADTFT